MQLDRHSSWTSRTIEAIEIFACCSEQAGSALSTLAFQVDLWSARGRLPQDLTEVGARQKEIQFSSRTRASTDQIKRMQTLRAAPATLLRNAPASVRETEEAKRLAAVSSPTAINIVQLIYKSKAHEGTSKDYNFSRRSMIQHWRAGHADALHALQHKEIFERPHNQEHFRAFDFSAESKNGKA